MGISSQAPFIKLTLLTISTLSLASNYLNSIACLTNLNKISSTD